MFWLQQFNQKNMGGQLLQQTYKAMQLEVGSGLPFFLLPYKRLKKATTNTWIKDMWQFMREHKIELKGKLPSMKPMRKNDDFIMDMLLQDRTNSNTALAACNRYSISPSHNYI